jgi:hypothetical protein
MTDLIGAGVPSDREDWPSGVLDRLCAFKQGDVVPCPPIVYQGDPAYPVYGMTAEYAKVSTESGPMMITGDAAPTYAVLTSATCDISEEDKRAPRFPFVQLSPIVDMTAADVGLQGMIRKDKVNYLVHLPALSTMKAGFWVADLRIEYPVDKGWLAGQERFAGFQTETDQQKIGAAIAYLRQRPAMARSFVDNVLGPLEDLLGELRKIDRALAQRVDNEAVEWAVRTDSRLNPGRIEIVLLADAGEFDPGVREWWRLAVDSLRTRAGAADEGLTIIGPRFERLDTLSVSDYRKLTILPIPHNRFSV